MGLIHSSWGGTPIASWISGPSLVSNARLEPLLTFWENVILQYPANQSRYQLALKRWEAGGSQGARPAAPMGPGNAHEPTSLYNGMIAPLAKYTIKGALWYQGETEAGRAQGHVYGDALMTLVQDWRKAFGQGDFPFYWVQLANYGNAAKNGHWMRVQEGQVKATALRNTGVVVINDIGNPTDIHPTNKQDVGRRLALLAQDRGASPLYRQFTREGAAIRIWFDHAGTELRVRGGGSLKGFQIAGADGKYVAATAVDRGHDRRGLEPGRRESAVGALRVGLQPGRESDQRPRPASVDLPDARERRTLISNEAIGQWVNEAMKFIATLPLACTRYGVPPSGGETGSWPPSAAPCALKTVLAEQCVQSNCTAGTTTGRNLPPQEIASGQSQPSRQKQLWCAHAYRKGTA